MPKLDLTIPADSLSEESQQQLARDLGAHAAALGGSPRHRVLPLDHLGPRPRAAGRSRSRRRTASPSRTPSSRSRSRAARSASGGRPAWSRTPPSSCSRRPAGAQARCPRLDADPRGPGRELGGRRPGRPLRAAPRGRQGRARAGGLREGEGPGRRPSTRRSRHEAARSSSRRGSSSGATRRTRSSGATARRSSGRSRSRPATSTSRSSRGASRLEPFPFGHECVAEVTDVGDSVRTVEPGDLVSVPFQISCGECAACRDGRTGNCESVPRLSTYGLPIGRGLRRLRQRRGQGSLSPTRCWSRSRRGSAPPTVASLSDNIPDAWRCVAPALAERPGSPVLIAMGAGSIALYSVAIALALGAERVDVVGGS